MTDTVDAPRRGTRLLVALAQFAIGCLPVAVVAVAWSWPAVGAPSDYLAALLTLPMGGFETEYAPGYSEWNFRKVRPGMKRAEVVALLGEPLAERHWDHRPGRDHVTMASYSLSPTHGHHWMRRVHYEHDVVTGVRAEFWID